MGVLVFPLSIACQWKLHRSVLFFEAVVVSKEYDDHEEDERIIKPESPGSNMKEGQRRVLFHIDPSSSVPSSDGVPQGSFLDLVSIYTFPH